jgi:glycosyltransferase involved in cell wall biosynthesis
VTAPAISVVHIIIGLDVGGAEHMLSRLVLQQRRVYPDRRLCVVSLTGMGSLGSRLLKEGIEVYTFGMHGLLDLPFAFFQLRKLLVELKPNIVQTWLYHADFIGGLAAYSAGIRNIIWGIRTTDVISGSVVVRILRLICGKLSGLIPKAIICGAEASRQSHILVGYKRDKLLVVPNGYNFDCLESSKKQRNTLRAELGIMQDELILGSVGRFHPDKNHKFFVRVAGILAAKNPKLRFLMIGRDINLLNEKLIGWINDSGFQERFILLGERMDVPGYMAAMDIFCLHSNTEGFPNVLAEAMALGLPCIATDVGDAAFVMSDTGRVVPRGDFLNMAKSISCLLNLDQVARQNLGKQGEIRIRSEFSISSAQERVEQIYQDVLEEKRF